jgi:hypothetical protein
MLVNKLTRFTALATLAAFFGLYAVQTLHAHAMLQSSPDCAVCQVAPKTPVTLMPAALIGPDIQVSHSCHSLTLPVYTRFVAVSHGLSPPSL